MDCKERGVAVPTHCCILYSTDVSTPRDGLAIGTSKYFDHIKKSYIRFTNECHDSNHATVTDPAVLLHGTRKYYPKLILSR